MAQNKQNKQLFAAEEDDWDPIADLRSLRFRLVLNIILLSIEFSAMLYVLFWSIESIALLFVALCAVLPIFLCMRKIRDIKDEIRTIKSIIRD